MKSNLGEKIKVMRKSRGWTQVELAAKAGLSPSAVAMYEINKRKPKYEQLEALADAFNVPMSAFLDEDAEDIKKRLEQEGAIENTTEWKAEYPAGVALRKDSQQDHRPRTSLTNEDIAAIASYIRKESGVEEGPKTSQARIISAGIDRMPEEDRNRALAVMQAVFAQYADFFKEEEGTDSEA